MKLWTTVKYINIITEMSAKTSKREKILRETAKKVDLLESLHSLYCF